MEIYFPDVELLQLFCSGNRLRGRFGDAMAEVICCRLQLLKRARSLALVPSAPPISLRSDPAPGVFTVSVGNGHHLLFEAVDGQAEPTGSRDINQIQAIRVLSVDVSPPDKGVQQ